MTNHDGLYQTLQRTCNGEHPHQIILGKEPGTNVNRSRLAQHYPRPLVDAILRAYADSLGRRRRDVYMVDAYEIYAVDDRMETIAGLCGCPLPETGLQNWGVSTLHECGALQHDGEGQEGEAGETAEDEVNHRAFPGTHPLSLEALVKRAHEGLGHPSKERFIRILKYSKADRKSVV